MGRSTACASIQIAERPIRRGAGETFDRKPNATHDPLRVLVLVDPTLCRRVPLDNTVKATGATRCRRDTEGSRCSDRGSRSRITRDDQRRNRAQKRSSRWKHFLCGRCAVTLDTLHQTIRVNRSRPCADVTRANSNQLEGTVAERLIHGSRHAGTWAADRTRIQGTPTTPSQPPSARSIPGSFPTARERFPFSLGP